MLAKADFIEGLAKGLAVLESFSPERQRLNATQVAERTGLSRAAARRQLLTLHHLGYLEWVDGYYWLAPPVLRLAGVYLSSSRLPRLLQPVLDRISQVTGEACSAAILDRSQVIIIARSLGRVTRDQVTGPSKNPALTAYGMHQGARLAAHATSTGRVLLANLPKPQFNEWLKQNTPLARFTPLTVTDLKQFRAILESVRRDDYSLVIGEHEASVSAVAVPVRNASGKTVAAVNLLASAERLRSSALNRELLPAMRELVQETRELL